MKDQEVTKMVILILNNSTNLSNSTYKICLVDRKITSGELPCSLIQNGVGPSANRAVSLVGSRLVMSRWLFNVDTERQLCKRHDDGSFIVEYFYEQVCVGVCVYFVLVYGHVCGCVSVHAEKRNVFLISKKVYICSTFLYPMQFRIIFIDYTLSIAIL